VTSRTKPSFWKCYKLLPKQIQAQARKAFQLFKRDIHHPSLNFKLLRGYPDVYSVRISRDYRATAIRENDVIIWVWIGSHKEFDRMFG
jgi:hypothetical protein